MPASKRLQKPTIAEQTLFLGGTILFALLGILSILFWKERQAYDAAHYLLEIIIRKNFFVAHQRPAGIVSQILPLIGVYLNAPLSWLMKLYSIGDILFYYLIFVWLTQTAKHYGAALTLLLSYLLTVCYSFYCPVTELLQGMALLPVMWVLLENTFRFRIPTLIVLMAFIIFSHPLLFIPTGIMIGWWWNQQKEKNIMAMVMTVGFVVITGLKLLLLDKYDYQKTYYPVVFNDYSNMNNLTDGNYIFSFLNMLVTSYPVVGLIALLTLVMLLFRKVYLQATYFLLTLFGFLLIIICTHRFIAITNYSERMLLPLAFIIALPFSREIMLIRTALIKQVLLFGLMIFFLFRVNEIRNMSNDYSLRIAQMNNLIQTSRAMGHQKTIADEEILEQVPSANSGWCYSIETMLFSSLEGPEKTVSIAMQHDHIDRIKEAGITLQPNQWIKWMEYILKDDTLPANYFQFKPQVYSSLRNDGNVPEKLLGLVKCTIEKPIRQNSSGSNIITVRFKGLGNHSVPAKSSAMRIRYKSQDFSIPLVSDIISGCAQQVCLPSEIENPDDISIDIIPVKQ
jgi:hypothetical protein